MRCIEVVHCLPEVSRKLNRRYSWGCLGFDRQKRLHFEIFIFAKNPKFDMPTKITWIEISVKPL